MNKNIINDEIQYAYEALINNKIAENNKINKTYRGQISSFGAAITMGSLLSAIAFFSADNNATVSREKIMATVLDVIKKNNTAVKENSLYEYVRKESNAGREASVKEEIVNASIAIKLAMNLFELEKKEGKDGKKQWML